MQFTLPKAPDSKGLRKYGLVTGTGIALLFGLIFPMIFGVDWPVWPHLLGGLFVLTAVVYPPILAPVYRVWMGIALVLGHLNSKVLLTIVYLFVLTPIGLVRRWWAGLHVARRQRPEFKLVDNFRLSPPRYAHP